MPAEDAKAKALAALNSGASAGVLPQNEPRVWMGGGARLRPNDVTSDGAVIQRPRAGGHTVGMSEAQAEFYQWDEGQRSEWGQYLVSMGLIEEDEAGDYGTLLKAWSTAVEESAKFTAAGRKVSPRDVIKLMGSAGGAKGGGFSGTRTTTSRNIDLTDPTTAKALVNDVLSRQLGRAATPEEINQFTQVLNTAERANPSVTTSSTTYEDGQAISQSSSTEGGLTQAGAQQLLTDKAMASPEYGAYQAASVYMNSLLQGIGAVV